MKHIDIPNDLHKELMIDKARLKLKNIAEVIAYYKSGIDISDNKPVSSVSSVSGDKEKSVSSVSNNKPKSQPIKDLKDFNKANGSMFKRYTAR